MAGQAPDSVLHDGVALDEIRLLGELMVAAADTERVMPGEQVDAVLASTQAPERPLGSG